MSRHQIAVKLKEDWIADAYDNPNLPFVIDVGCGKGLWALQYAQAHSGNNVLGIDIRNTVVEVAMDRVRRLDRKNLFYLCCNANVNIPRVMKDIKSLSNIDMIAINFPDPYFKKAHHKRRLVNELFLKSLAAFIDPGTKVFFQSDVLNLSQSVLEEFNAVPWFALAEGFTTHMLHQNPNPTGILTEREISVLNKNLPVYRVCYKRNSVVIPTPPSDSSMIDNNGRRC